MGNFWLHPIDNCHATSRNAHLLRLVCVGILCAGWYLCIVYKEPESITINQNFQQNQLQLLTCLKYFEIKASAPHFLSPLPLYILSNMRQKPPLDMEIVIILPRIHRLGPGFHPPMLVSYPIPGISVGKNWILTTWITPSRHVAMVSMMQKWVTPTSQWLGSLANNGYPAK
jgi:hypothetical protein